MAHGEKYSIYCYETVSLVHPVHLIIFHPHLAHGQHLGLNDATCVAQRRNVFELIGAGNLSVSLRADWLPCRTLRFPLIGHLRMHVISCTTIKAPGDRGFVCPERPSRKLGFVYSARHFFPRSFVSLRLHVFYDPWAKCGKD
jgi:hypothetical protein